MYDVAASRWAKKLVEAGARGCDQCVCSGWEGPQTGYRLRFFPPRLLPISKSQGEDPLLRIAAHYV